MTLQEKGFCNCKGSRMTFRIYRKGFSTVELLVAMAISGVVMAAIYSAYYSQQKSYSTQDQIVAMQQNLRAAMFHMEREIRMAGYDPTGEAGAGIVSASANSINVTMDITDNPGTAPDGDGDTLDTNEDVTYSLYTANSIQKLGRNSQPVAENIDALDFVYLDENGNVTANLSNIKSVQISLVARTNRGDQGYTNTTVYSNQQGTVIYTALGDNVRRRLLTVEVRCRNLGLQ